MFGNQHKISCHNSKQYACSSNSDDDDITPIPHPLPDTI